MSVYKGGSLIAGGSQATPLLSFVWADHELNDISWLRADTFSWQSGAVYQAAYQHLAEDLGNTSGSWTNPVNPLSENYSWIDMVYGNGTYVSIARNGKTGVSTNLTSWSEYSGSQNGLGSHGWSSIIWDGTKYVAVGGSGGGTTNPFYFATSSDGVSWTVSTIDTLIGISPTSLVWDGTKYLVYGAKLQDYYVATSQDGVNWTAPSAISVRASDVIKGLNKFVMVGYFGTVATSVDGINWTDQGDPLNIGSPGNSWSAVGFNGFQYVALSQEGYYATSPDGINWTTPVAVPSLSGAYRQWDCLTYDGQQLVSLGYTGHITKYNTEGYSSETVAGTTVSYFQSPDGHKICPANQEPAVAQVYASTGVAWYYILDTINQRFKLPRTKFGFTGLRDTVGGYVEPGVPNLNGYLGSPAFSALGGTDGILFKQTSVHAAVLAGGGWDAYQIGFDASRVSSVYNNSNTVQPPATQMYLYFYVGQFTQTATQNTAGLNAELFNAKAAVDMDNISAAGRTTAVGWVMPDYANGTALTISNTYQSITDDGYLYFYGNGGGSWVDIGVSISLDGSTELLKIVTSSTYQVSEFIPVTKGIYVKPIGVTSSMWFCPSKK